ncbi:MAG: hypothetical protein HKN03_02190 [Acidimicrobiales bacterium]|nr:hypothetical protein [Acidimicrobiales bacterium]
MNNQGSFHKKHRSTGGRSMRLVAAITVALSLITGSQSAGAAEVAVGVNVPGIPISDSSGSTLDPTAPSQPADPEQPPPQPDTRPAEEVVNEALASPQFVQAVGAGELENAGLDTVRVAPGGKLDLAAFVEATSLRHAPEVDQLFEPQFQRLIGAAPKYEETIIELEDRIVIDREVTVKPLQNPCGPQRDRALHDFCVTINSDEEPSPGLAKNLDKIRKQLAQKGPGRRVSGNVRVRHALAMDDAELLNLLVNSGERSIRRVTVLPITGPNGITGPNSVTAAPLVAHTAGITAGAYDATETVAPLVLGPEFLPPGSNIDYWGGAPKFNTKYFLTGFSYGKAHEDTWEYTIAKKTWWHGRYYIKFDYSFAFGFGVRAPFSIDVTHRSGGGSGPMQLELAVAPVNVSANGSPAYQATGLPGDKTFDGKEFVLEARANCSLKISIPGPDPKTRNCPGFDKSFSEHIDPVIGNERSSIDGWWLKGGEETNLILDVGVAYAALDIGVDADITNGKIGMRVDANDSTKLTGGVSEGMVWFDRREPVAFTAERSSPGGDYGFTVSDPRYGFDINLRPKIQGRVGIDVGIIEDEWTLGPWSLDFLEFGFGFELGRHSGTVGSHTYNLKTRPLVVDEVHDPDVGETVTQGSDPSPFTVYQPPAGAVASWAPAAPSK